MNVYESQCILMCAKKSRFKLSRDALSNRVIGYNNHIGDRTVMGFTAWLAIVYILLALLAGISFAMKKKKAGICVLTVMILSIVVLGYMWITSPM